jgi:GNAT superfamily N-acetyltransferase
MTPDIYFKVADLGDIPDLLAMMFEFNAIDAYPFNPELTKNNLEIFIQNPDLGRIWLISTNNNILMGYACLAFGFSFEYGGRDAFLDEFYIRAPWRGKGVGQIALEVVETEAILLGVNAMHLEVEHSNVAGNRLYEKNGYKGKHRYMLTKRLPKEIEEP